MDYETLRKYYLPEINTPQINLPDNLLPDYKRDNKALEDLSSYIQAEKESLTARGMQERPLP